MRQELYESEIERIQASGAESRLEKHAQQTGQEPTPAMRKLALDTDQIGIFNFFLF